MSRALAVAAVIFTTGFCYGQNATTVSASELQQLIDNRSKPIHVINFWATWCGPCVKELPYFEKVTAGNDPDVKITLVSLDLDLDPDPQKVYNFISRKGIRSHVVLLNEDDPNSWIDQIEPQWSGALPATIIINHETGKRKFIGRSLHEGELEKYLDEIK